MKVLRSSAFAVAAVLLAHAANAQPTVPAPPPFDVAYRAWDVLMESARHNGDATIGGECGKTFRPFVIPGLRRQTRQEEDAAAVECVRSARAVCTNTRLKRSAETARKCEEFR
ncbi:MULTISPECIES: hypothetical protein [Ramlibacter]|uniref:Uncharacterized protein n=1 Tax=Ramlibacter pinisoli TaxID=2682844 RepID=A0A6N8IY12_9BURK|nr:MULTISPECIES: hypothetical protein [Ramlibacter]MBA2961715.1 hypothetical protein [Ramlibacter sp. CGMCC 1.13660]MVQ31658.1 hypothetical protein [Ramlibacter pinisoli]